MEQGATLSLVDRLIVAARLWATTNDASMSLLALQVVNDRGFFSRLPKKLQGTTTATLEKFAGFLADPGNWPDGMVPQEAVDLAHRVGISTGEAQDRAA